MASSVDPDQLFAAEDFSRRHFQMHFFLALKGLQPTFYLKTERRKCSSEAV